MDIGPKVKKFRELRGFSLTELAEKSGVSKGFLWEIEQGNSKRPGAEVLFKVATALDVTIADLLGKKTVEAEPDEITPEINSGLREFIDERKRRGEPLVADEIRSLAFIQFRGGRPQTKNQWEQIYVTLRNTTGRDGA